MVTDGNYSVGPYGHDYWLKSGPFFLHHNGHKLDTDNGTLKVSVSTLKTTIQYNSAIQSNTIQ